MNRTTQFAAIVVLVGGIGGTALAQSGGLAKQAEAARLQKLKAQRDAAIAAAKQRAAGTPTTTPTPSPTTPSTTISRTSPIPTVTTTTTTPTATPTTPATTPTTTPTAATTTTATAAASAAASNSAKPAGSAAPVGSATPLPPKDRTDTAAIALDLEALKKSRPDRRHAEVVDLQARFGDSLLADARSAPELKLHAQRIAYLQRIRALAVKANDAKTVKDVDTLITKEELRSANAMNALRSGALPVAAAPAAAPAGGTK